ncbi:MAG: hypothetical protein U0746_09220 [Gemmataceae bacterium]
MLLLLVTVVPVLAAADLSLLSPPAAWVALTCRPDRLPGSDRLIGFLFVAVLYAVAASLLYWLAKRRFCREAVAWSGSRS